MSDRSPLHFKTIEEISALRLLIQAQRKQNASIGFIPTMGALHDGHLSLIETARRECDFVVVSIFVNPTQFGPTEDFEKYPRLLEQDLANCQSAGADLVWIPTSEIMYPSGFSTSVKVTSLSHILEGTTRTNHFEGVTTIVTKLLLSCLPDVAYFGAKDYQQQAVIRRMCLDLNIPVEIQTCPTIRAADGLALSSRNAFLSKAERTSALALSRALKLAEKKIQDGETDLTSVKQEMQQLLNATPLLKLDYATIVNGISLEEIVTPQPDMVALIAAYVGETRLIDNCLLQPISTQ